MSDREANGSVRGATEALSVLHNRPRAEQPPISDYAAGMLARLVDGKAWRDAGLPPLVPQSGSVSVSDEAVVRLARLVVSIHGAGLSAGERLAIWSRLERFFARYLSVSAPELVRLRAVVCHRRLEADGPPPAIVNLQEILAFQREVHGEDAYITGLTRATLSDAHRQSGDLVLSASLLATEAQLRENRYGGDHPITLVARSMLARTLLLQAEAASDPADRLALARRALGIISAVRMTRDRLYGQTASNATRSRRYEAHALLLLGEFDRARAFLEHTIAFDVARDGRRDLRAVGQAHLLLARVHAAQGKRDQALVHAVRAQHILAAHLPQGTEFLTAAALAREIAIAPAE